MRSLCRFSLRWHQQFQHSLQSSPHRHCLQPSKQLVRTYRRLPRTDRSRIATDQSKRRDDGLVVREYEQVGAGSDGRRKTIPWGPDKEQDLQNKYLQAKLQELEKEIAHMKDGPFGRESPYLKSLPADARNEILKQIEEDGGFDLDDESFSDDELEAILEDEQSSDPHVVNSTPAVTLKIPQQQKIYVKHFNQAIEQVEYERSEEAQTNLLKWYLRCQQHVSGFSKIISENVWLIIWNSQVARVSRPKYLVIVAQDMITADFKMSSVMWISYIRALRASGDTASAVTAWEECKGAIRGNDEHVAELFALGVDLYSDLGQPQKAEDLIPQCSSLTSKQKVPLYTSLVSAWAKSNDRQATQHAWIAYLALKQLGGKQTKIDQLTKISTALLQNGKRDMALAVFRDLITSVGPDKHDSSSTFARLIQLTADANTERMSAAHIDETALKALSALPKQFNNKYFYGAWIKQLIGAGEVDGAADVAELMHERGIRLDAKHLNGIVGAWFRNGTKSAQLKAEDFAWAMVHARIALVRKQDYQSQVPSLPSSTHDSAAAVPNPTPEISETTMPVTSSQKATAVRERPIPHFLRRSAPAATIETFSLLLRHYTIRSDLASAEYLTKLMEGPAQMQPNAYIMNHWLYSLLRRGEVDQVWARYIALTNRHSDSDHLRTIKPDLETFAALWDAAKVAYNPSRAAEGKQGAFPDARLLFSEFTQWYTSLSTKDQSITATDFPMSIYDVVARCFCLQSDYPGLLCAIWCLRKTFNAAPGIDTAQIICLSVAKQMTRESRAHNHGRIRGSAARRTMWIEEERRHLFKLGELLEGLEETTRIDHAVKLDMSIDQVSGDRFKLDEEQEKGVRVEALKDFLFNVIRRFSEDVGAGETVSQRMQEAALQMDVDVSDMVMGGMGPDSGIGRPKL